MQIQDETWRKLKERTQTGAAAAGAVCDLTCCVQQVRPLNLKISNSGNLILLALPVTERDFWIYVASFHLVPHVF
jgi:hypothetical protein